MANPPFSLKNWGAEVWAQDSRAIGGVPPRTNADWAWVQHMLASMTPGTGRVGVVMPHGVLFRGAAEARIREAVVTSDQLDAVIGLPNNLFYSTSIPACLLILRGNKPPERKDHVLFIDGSARFTKGRNQNDMTEEDIAAVLEAYRTGDDPDGEGGAHVRRVPLAEIETNGWDLNIGRYITTTTDDDIDLDTALANYLDAREARIASEAALFDRLRAAGIADLGGSDD
jgi:type I restriction enzyme M protein